MFGIGTQELIILMVVALIVFGPQRLPEIAGQIGKAIRDFRQMSADVTGEFNRTLNLDSPPPPAQPEPAPVPGQQTIDAQPVTAPVADTSLATHTNGADDERPATAVELQTETVATKADPRAAVSLLDEDGPAEPGSVVFRPADDDVIDRSTEIVPTSEADAVLATPGGSTAEPGDAGASAWDAVITTDATGPQVAMADQPDGATAEGATAPEVTWTPPERIVVDPADEVTIREKIEAQIAAEAFRERRRNATYNRGRKGR